MLNLYLLDDLSIHDDANIKFEFLDVMRRLTTYIDGQYNWVVAKFQAFKEHKGVFANMPLAMEGNIQPHKWWDFVSEGGTHLVPLAKRVLALIWSSLSCERN